MSHLLKDLLHYSHDTDIKQVKGIRRQCKGVETPNIVGVLISEVQKYV